MSVTWQWISMLRLIPGLSINSQRYLRHSNPHLKKKNGSGIAQSDFEKADRFNGQFTDVFTKTVHNQVPLLDRSAQFMDELVVMYKGRNNKTP